MERDSANIANVSSRLVAMLTNNIDAADARNRRMLLAFEELGSYLAVFLGKSSFRIMVLRSLTLAGEQTGWLQSLTVKDNGSLEGLEEIEAHVAPDDIAVGLETLLTELLGLLVTLTGRGVTMKIVHDVWPHLNAAATDQPSH